MFSCLLSLYGICCRYWLIREICRRYHYKYFDVKIHQYHSKGTVRPPSGMAVMFEKIGLFFEHIDFDNNNKSNIEINVFDQCTETYDLKDICSC